MVETLILRLQLNLEYDLRLQQYIELVRSRDTTKFVEATVHARKYLNGPENLKESIEACGLLAYPPTTRIEPYRVSHVCASQRCTLMSY